MIQLFGHEAESHRVAMKAHFAAICALLGSGFALTGSFAAIRTLAAGFMAARNLMAMPDSTPSNLTAVIGETIISIFSRGVLLLPSAILIYLAFFPLRQRDPIYFSVARLSCYCMLIAFPVGTLAGIVLLILLRRIKREMVVSDETPRRIHRDYNEATTPTKADQNGCRQRLEGCLSCQQRPPLAVA